MRGGVASGTGRGAERQEAFRARTRQAHPHGLVREPPGAQLGVGDVGGADLLALAFGLPDRLEQADRRRGRRGGLRSVEPELAGGGGIVDGGVAHRVGAAQRRRVGRRVQCLVVVLAARGVGRPQRSVLHETGNVEVGEVVDRLEIGHIAFERVDQRRLEGRVERRAARPVVQVDHLLRQPAALGDEASRLQRLGVEEVGGIELRLQEGVEHLRVIGRVGPPHHHAVQGRIVQLGPVVEQLGLALVHQQSRPGDELRKRLDLTRFQRRGTDLWLLVEHLHTCLGVDTGLAEGLHQHAVAG